MANRYWVGGSGTWNTTSTTNWSATSGGAGGASVPTSADSVFFDRTGTYTVTLTGALNCLDFNVSAGAVTFSSTGTISIAGSVSITNVTPTWSATGTLTYTATTAKTIATNGTSFNCSMTFNGVGGSWQLSSALTIGNTNTITLTNGTLNLNGFTLSCGLFNSNNSNIRTLAFGTGNITTTGSGTAWTTGTTTNLTITGTPVVNISNNSATATTVTPGSLSETSSISFNFTTGTYALSFLNATPNTAMNVNFTGFAGSWTLVGNNTIYGNLTISTGMTIGTTTTPLIFGATSGTKTITTNGKTLDFPITFNGVGGTWQLQDALTAGSTRIVTLTNGTLDLNNKTLTTGSFSTSNSNIRTLAFGTGNITLTGTGSVWTTTTTTNLTITGTPVANLTNSGAVATSVAAGAGLPETSNISFNITAGTYALSFSAAFAVRNLNFTGFSGTWSWSGGVSVIYGNVTFSSGMTVSSSTATLTFGGTSGINTITTNGKSLDFAVTFDGVGGTWQLQDALTLGSTRQVTLTNGTLDLNSKTLTAGSFGSNNSNTRTLAFGTGNITLLNSGSVWSMSTSTGFTATGTEVVNISNNTATASTIAAGSVSESNSITFNITTGTYALTISGAVNSLNFTGFSGSITGIPVTIYGNLTVSSGMTINASASITTFAATSGVKTITTNGKTLDFPITFNGVGGTWQLQDALTQGSTRTTNLTAGTLDLNGKTYTSGSSFISSGTSVRNITFNAGTFVCTGTTTAFSASGSNLTTTKGTGEGYITLSNTTSNRTFAGGGFVYNCTLYVTVGNTATTITISGANTFRNIQTNATGLELFVSTIAFPASTTTTFLVSFGLNYISIGSSTPGTQATLSLASGTILALSMTITDSNATGGAIWKADKNSINGGNNSGWIFLTNIGGEFFVFF